MGSFAHFVIKFGVAINPRIMFIDIFQEPTKIILQTKFQENQERKRKLSAVNVKQPQQTILALKMLLLQMINVYL